MPDTITTSYEELRKLYQESAHLLTVELFDNQLTICEQYQKYQQLKKQLNDQI